MTVVGVVAPRNIAPVVPETGAIAVAEKGQWIS
jgi:hypothetical protein